MMDTLVSEKPVAARLADPCTLVIFGAAGDLTKRLLIPALYNLVNDGLLPDEFAVIGVARAEMSAEDLRQNLGDALKQFATTKVAAAKAKWLLNRVDYVQGDFGDPGAYQRLKERLARNGGNHLFYLATPPAAFSLVIEGLGEAGMTRDEKNGWRRLIIEKPFGTDLASAKELDRELLRYFDEKQIFRIDHYLGKETVQNIMVMRFANGLFEPIWNRDHIDHVQITVAETVNVESRGGFYDATGALRDMVPNHLFQLLAMTSMGPPNCFGADAVRSEKAKVLDAVRRMTPADVAKNVVRAQYTDGIVNGKPVVAYREAPDVAPHSTAETYVAMRLMIDNWRWAGVPFYLRTGKALAVRKSIIAIKFRQPPIALFRDVPEAIPADNFLVLRIQPDEGVTLEFNAKVPGEDMRIGHVRMDFQYRDYFRASPSTGYETLIYDCMIGDQTLFQRADNVEVGWSVVQPILDAWRRNKGKGLAFYQAGSEGPAEADALLARDGRAWRPLT
ncbi:MAG: zwf [Rhodospirillales bacterium]|jgi:glucose-6-phosphate 1-dehydrogenase|nr:zwf [Rhodospirillales bacterium]